jgi:autotransporter-associated beta strand protein
MNIDGFNANEVVTIQNDGTITGNGVTGDGDGVDVDGIVNLTNTGVIQSFNAFSDVPSGASEGVTTGGGTITNSGTIEGDVVMGNVNAVGRGITLAGVDTSGTPEPIYADSVVTNSGLIKGQTDSAIVVLGAASSFTVTINNEAGGTIEGGGDTAPAIQTAADNDTLNNAGEVIADASGKAIDLGDGDDTLNITGGTIHGDISGGNGTNTCTIDPGASHFNYTGSISDFDSVEIRSGGVSFFGASSYTGTTTISGGTLTAANSTGSGAVQVTGGTLGGTGSIGGAVSIGGGSGSATLAPRASSGKEATLTIQSTLTFQAGGTYL